MMDGQPVKLIDSRETNPPAAIVRLLPDSTPASRTSATSQNEINAVLPGCRSDHDGLTFLATNAESTPLAQSPETQRPEKGNIAEFKGSIYLIGGKAELCFDELIKTVGENPKVAVVGLASATDADRASGKEHPDEDLAREFLKQGVALNNITIIIPKNYTNNDTEFKHQYEVPANVNLVYFGGGAQDRLRNRFDDHQLGQVQELLKDGATIAGNSAGTAVMSREMIADGPVTNLVHKPGFGLTPWLIMDTHVNARPGRIQRDVKAFFEIGKSEQPVVGLDEDTSIRISWRNVPAMGKDVDGGIKTIGSSRILKAEIGGVGAAHIIDSRKARLQYNRMMTPSVVTDGIDTKKEASLTELRAGDSFEIERFDLKP